MLHACALVGWYTCLCTNQPPVLIFSTSAQMNIMNIIEMNSLAKLSKNPMQHKTGSQTTPVPKHLHVQLIKEVCDPILLFLPDFH